MAIMHANGHTFLVGKESTFGTAVPGTKDLGLIQGSSPTDSNELEPIHATGDEEPQELLPVMFKSTNEVEFYFQNGRIFEYITGGTITHALTSGDTKHTFSLADSLPSFTYEDSFNATTDVVNEYAGTKVVSVDVSFRIREAVRVKASIMSKTVDISSASASAAVIDSIVPLAAYDMDLKVGVIASEASVGLLQDATLTIDRATKEVEAAGSREIPEADPDATPPYKVVATIGFQNQTIYKQFLNGTTGTAPASTNWTGNSLILSGNNGVALGSGRVEISCTLRGVKVFNINKVVRVGEKVFATIEWHATTLYELFTVDDIAEAAWS